MADDISIPTAPAPPPEGFMQGQPIGAPVTTNVTAVKPGETIYAQTKDGFASLPSTSFEALMQYDPNAKVVAPPGQGQVLVKLSSGHGATLPMAQLSAAQEQDPGLKVIAHGGPQMNPQGTDKPGMEAYGEQAGSHFMQSSGIAPVKSLISMEAAHRLETFQQAVAAFRAGNYTDAVRLAYFVVSGADPGDPLAQAAAEIIKHPVQEAQEAYKAARSGQGLEAAQHAIESVPVVGGIGKPIGEDIAKREWGSLIGDVFGPLATLAMGEFLGPGARTAEEGAAARAELNAANKDAADEVAKHGVRPDTMNIAGVEVPTFAPQAAEKTVLAKGATKLGSEEGLTKAITEQTQPAAVQATHANFAQSAESDVNALRSMRDQEPIKMSARMSLDETAAQLRREAADTYSKLDTASEDEVSAYQEQVEQAEQQDADALKKWKAEGQGNTPKPEPTELPEKPKTFRQLQDQINDAEYAAAHGDQVAKGEARKNLPAYHEEMDKFIADHSDIVDPTEVNAADQLTKRASRYDWINKKLRTATKGTTDTASSLQQVPETLNAGSLERLKGQFNNRFGEGAFEQMLGTDGLQNYNNIINLLQTPKMAMTFTKWLTRRAAVTAGGAAAGGAIAGPVGGVVGLMAPTMVRSLIDHLLFDPEFGSYTLNAFGRAIGAVRSVAPIVGRTTAAIGATHVYTPGQGIQPVQPAEPEQSEQ
jgi:hypothetical protein